MSNDDFDGLPSGSGETPTKDQVLTVYNYLRTHNREFSTGKVLDEMLALGFSTSRAAIGRFLKGAPGRAEPKIRTAVTEATERVKRRRLNNRHEHKKQKKEPEPRPDVAAAAAAIDPEKLGAIAARLVELLKKDDGAPAFSSTQLAIEENRTAMALNIVIAETMSMRPELLLLDMRGTAALVDALTIARKLSGGASIDISMPSAGQPHANGANGVSPNGHPMKELNPPSGLATDLMRFRRERAAELAQRA